MITIVFGGPPLHNVRMSEKLLHTGAGTAVPLEQKQTPRIMSYYFAPLLVHNDLQRPADDTFYTHEEPAYSSALDICAFSFQRVWNKKQQTARPNYLPQSLYYRTDSTIFLMLIPPSFHDTIGAANSRSLIMQYWKAIRTILDNLRTCHAGCQGNTNQEP